MIREGDDGREQRVWGGKREIYNNQYQLGDFFHIKSSHTW